MNIPFKPRICVQGSLPGLCQIFTILRLAWLNYLYSNILLFLLQIDIMHMKLLPELANPQNALGRTDPIPIVVKYDVMGMGRMEMELDYADDATERRRVMEVEKQDTEELRQKYKDFAEKEKAIAKALEDLRANFYCELCDKQYQKHLEFDNHINSYDHAHKQRLKDLKQREFARNVSSKSRKDEKKQERALRRLHELAELRKQQECAPGSGPMFKATTVAVEEDANDDMCATPSDSIGGKPSGSVSPTVNKIVLDKVSGGSSREAVDNTGHFVCGSPAGTAQSSQPFSITLLKNNSSTPLQKLSFSFAKKVPIKLDSSASVFSDMGEEINESEIENTDDKVLSGQESLKLIEVETPVTDDNKVEGLSPSESDNDSINSTLSKLKKMMKKDEEGCQSEPEYYHYIPPAHCKVKPKFPFLLFMKATESTESTCGNTKNFHSFKKSSSSRTVLNPEERRGGECEGDVVQSGNNKPLADAELDEETQSPETASKEASKSVPTKPIACVEAKQQISLVNPEVPNGPKQVSDPFFPVLSKDESTTLQWPSELLMVTKTEPCVSYSCNPLYFEFKLARHKQVKRKSKENEDSHTQSNPIPTDQDAQENKANIKASDTASKTKISEDDIKKPQEEPSLSLGKLEVQVNERDTNTVNKDKSLKSHKHKKKKKHKKTSKHSKEKANVEGEELKDGAAAEGISKKRKKHKRKNKGVDEKQSKGATLEVSKQVVKIEPVEEGSHIQKKRQRLQDDFQCATVSVEESSSRKEESSNFAEEPSSKKQKTGTVPPCNDPRKRSSSQKDSRSRHRNRGDGGGSSREEESDSYDESCRKRSRQKSSSRYSEDYDSGSDRSYSRRSRRRHSSSRHSSRRSYSSDSDASSDGSGYSRRRSYSDDSYSDSSDRSRHRSKLSHDSDDDYDYRRSKHKGKKRKYSSSDDYRSSRSRSNSRGRTRTRTHTISRTRTRSRSRTRSSSHSRSRSKSSRSITQRSWKRSRSYSRDRSTSARHRSSRRSSSRGKGSHSHDSSSDRRSSRRNSSRSFSRDRVYRSKSPRYSRSRQTGKRDESLKKETKVENLRTCSTSHNLPGVSGTGKLYLENQPTQEERNSLTAKQLLEKIQSKKSEKKPEVNNEAMLMSNKVGIKLKDPPQGYFGPKLPPALGNKAMLPLIGKLPTNKKPTIKKNEGSCSDRADKGEDQYLGESKDLGEEEASNSPNWTLQEEMPIGQEKIENEEIPAVSCEPQFEEGFASEPQIANTFVSDLSAPTEIITEPSDVRLPEPEEAVVMHYPPHAEPFSNYIPQVQENEEDFQEDVNSSLAPLDRQPITFTPEEMEKYSKLQQAAQQHIQQQLMAKQVKNFPTSAALAPAPALQQFHIQQPTAAATATSITTVHHAILQHQAAAAAAIGIHPHAHPHAQPLAQIHHIPQSLTPISLSHLAPSLYPTHPTTFLTSHPIHIIPASALHPGPLALHPVPHALYPALFAPRPGSAGAASALHLHPFLHPIFSGQELQHPPNHGT
uniref:C2H2-type domain-containing protein n=2 Tax=Callorhinchus milii TaxID=7868 RepID=A0A4W3ID51_CALMI|eukprot:gi/632966901/ref/XP_007899676.1/ PREDICTED: G patch domain-containing protein 8 isoform X1 [Callorhinchus milii]